MPHGLRPSYFCSLRIYHLCFLYARVRWTFHPSGTRSPARRRGPGGALRHPLCPSVEACTRAPPAADVRSVTARGRMSEAYDNVVGGGLKLKGGGIGKKKKKKSLDQLSDPAAAAEAASSAAAEGSSSSSAAPPMIMTTGGGLTQSEKRRRETMLQRDLAKAERGETKSHREKVKDFNNYLSSMTEHYDLPKVSKGN